MAETITMPQPQRGHVAVRPHSAVSLEKGSP